MRLLMAALCADEYRNIQFKGRPVWQKLFKPYLTMAEVAMQRWWWLDEVAHTISFRKIRFVTRTGDTRTGPVSNGATEQGGSLHSELARPVASTMLKAKR